MNGQPLHMQRAEAVLHEAKRHLDLWLEVADARAPISSRLPRLRRILSSVDAALVLTHVDWADPQAVRAWRAVLPGPCFAIDARAGVGSLGRWLEARMGRPPLRLFVAGMPNVGKSTLINRLAGARAAHVGARAGVTRAEQWVRRGNYALLDLPGILPRTPSVIAAAIGLVPEGQYAPQETAEAVLRALRGAAQSRYGELLPDDLLGSVARSAGLLGRGGAADIERAARRVLQDLRTGLLRPAQLEWPEDGE